MMPCILVDMIMKRGNPQKRWYTLPDYTVLQLSADSLLYRLENVTHLAFDLKIQFSHLRVKLLQRSTRKAIFP